MTNRHTTENFIAKAKKLHGNRYIYTNTFYGKSNIHKVNIICRIHGEFSQQPMCHLRGAGCIPCGYIKNSRLRRLNYTETISKFQKMYPLYIYELREGRIASSAKIKVLCTLHNKTFYPTVNNHLSGSKCPLCSNRTKGNFNKNFIGKKTILYILKLKGLEVYKVGITSRGIEKRYAGSMKEFEIIYSYSYTNGEDAYKKEKEMLENSMNYLYKGRRLLPSGNTELRAVNMTQYL